MYENGSLTDLPFEEFKSAMLVLSPLPRLILLEEVMQQLCNVGEVRNPLMIEIYKTDEFAHSLNRSGMLPFKHVSNLLVLHLKSILTNIDS